MKTLLIVLSAVSLVGCAGRYYAPAYQSVYSQPVVIAPHCQNYSTYGEQMSCHRGAQQRYNEEQRMRENQAFRAGLGR
jgi:hypothetical protein